MVEVTAGGDQITEVKDDLVKDVTQNIENIKLEEVQKKFEKVSIFVYIFAILKLNILFRKPNRTKQRNQRNPKSE